MESIAALSLVANIIQVVDFSAKILSAAHEISQSGSTETNSDLERGVNHCKSLNDQLKIWQSSGSAAIGPLMRDNLPLKNLALESDKIAQEILNILGSLKVPRKGSKWKTLSQAVRTKWHAGEISDLESRLQRNREVLQYHVLISVKEDQIRGLIKDEETRKILESVLQHNKDLAANMTAQTDEILRHQQAGSQLALKHHHEVLNAISQQPHNTTGSQDDTAQRVKDMLYFNRKDDRFDDISEAHERTFNWALDDQASSGKWPSLLRWLREEGGVYWISGKAGSGKSTLMKYLDDDPRTMLALQTWAGSGDLVVASFYFWNHGAPIQRSQEGLFRSILWQILAGRPYLAPILFPDMFRVGAVWKDFPTFHQLRRAFKRLTTELSSTLKVAIIVDGLDEFEANKLTMKELAELFLTASKSSNFKALVSSRPLTSFEASFKNIPKLRLHQLTYNDITEYVHDEIGTHSHCLDLLVENKEAVMSIMTEVVDSASGVFLWVKLVVRNLVEGLDNCDTLSDLRRRLLILPRDLEDLFRHMLRSIPEQYKIPSSKIFQLLRCHQEGQFGHSPTAIRLAYAELDEAAVLQANVCPVSPMERLRKEKEVSLRLKSRCAGLVEVISHNRRISDENGLSEMPDYIEDEVVYLHKSVADFVARDDVWREILQTTMASEYNAPRTWLQCIIMEIKLNPLRRVVKRSSGYMDNLITDAMHFARLVEITTRVAPSALLDELDSTVSKRYCTTPELFQTNLEAVPSSCWYESYSSVLQSPLNKASHETFCSVLVSHGLELSAIEEIRREGANRITKLGRPLLDYACRPLIGIPLQPRLASLLLENGADPNQTWRNESIWQRALGLELYDLEHIKWVSVLKLLIQHKADLDVVLERTKRPYGIFRQSALRVVTSRFKGFLEGRKDPFRFAAEIDTPSRLLRSYLLNRRGLRVSCERMPASTMEQEQLRETVLGLIGLLKSKGAKEQEWHQFGDTGAFVEIDVSSSRDQSTWRDDKLVGRKESDEEKLADWGSILVEDLEPW